MEEEKKGVNTREKLPHQSLSTIINNPKSSITTNIQSFFKHSFGNRSYNPHLTEYNIPPSPDIPSTDLTQLEDFYKQILPVLH